MAAKPITLKVRDVALAAKAAYDEGRLSAQGPTPACKYRDASGRPCAVGAALDDATARRFDVGFGIGGASGVSSLERHGLLKVDDLGELGALQRAHDGWAQPDDALEAEARFVTALNRILNAP